MNLGVSAIGQVGNLYIQNYKSLQEYQGAIARGALPSHRGVRMTEDDWLRKDVIHQIMCYGGVDMAAVEHRHGIRFEEHFAAELERLHALATDGLVQLRDRRDQSHSGGPLVDEDRRHGFRCVCRRPASGPHVAHDLTRTVFGPSAARRSRSRPVRYNCRPLGHRRTAGFPQWLQ